MISEWWMVRSAIGHQLNVTVTAFFLSFFRIRIFFTRARFSRSQEARIDYQAWRPPEFLIVLFSSLFFTQAVVHGRMDGSMGYDTNPPMYVHSFFWDTSTYPLSLSLSLSRAHGEQGLRLGNQEWKSKNWPTVLLAAYRFSRLLSRPCDSFLHSFLPSFRPSFQYIRKKYGDRNQLKWMDGWLWLDMDMDMDMGISKCFER